MLDISDDMKLVRYNKEITDIELSIMDGKLTIVLSPSTKEDKKPLPFSMIYKLLERFPDAQLKSWGETAQCIEINFENNTIELKK